MGADKLLSRLKDVRRTGAGKWVARCPAHDDHRPSLSIRELEDGRVLVYDFTGCGAADVLDAVGLDWADLFPPRIEITGPTTSARRRPAPPIPAADALALLEREAMVVQLVAERILVGERLLSVDWDALAEAAGRISVIRDAWMDAP